MTEPLHRHNLAKLNPPLEANISYDYSKHGRTVVCSNSNNLVVSLQGSISDRERVCTTVPPSASVGCRVNSVQYCQHPVVLTGCCGLLRTPPPFARSDRYKSTLSKEKPLYLDPLILDASTLLRDCWELTAAMHCDPVAFPDLLHDVSTVLRLRVKARSDSRSITFD
jgi:hypothetical protein